MRATIRIKAVVGVLVLLVVGAGVLVARPATEPWRPDRSFDFQWYQKNQWRIPLTNYATFGYGIGRPGGEWPAGSGDMYIYGAGIWIGCLRRGASGRDTLVSCGYNPNSGSSEMTPGCYDNAPGGYSGRSFERVYIYPGDWPPAVGDFPASMHDSLETPLRIPSGEDTIKGYFYYIPRSAVSTGDAWTVFNDRDPEQHVAGTTPRPIGIEVYQTTYAWTLPWNKDIVFFKLDVRNRTDDTLQDVFLGMVCDADVGNATDDWCGLALSKYIRSPDGSDSVFVDNMGYVWSDDGVPGGFAGFDFLQSPYVVNPDGSIDGIDGIDNNENGLVDEPAEGAQLGMKSFKIFTLTDADPRDDFEQYLAMAGYDYWDPEYPYNPYDSTDQAPADKRFLQSTGPFTLAPDGIATVTIGLIAAERAGGGVETMVYNLALASRAAQGAYDNNWITPEPPPSPNVTLLPGDGRVTLVWDDFPESARDRFFPVAPALLNPYYIEQDFQGYKVYRSRTSLPDDWKLLARYDRIDGITYEDTTVAESLRTIAADAGLAYSYVDSSDLRLGFPYYYAVTSFDVNYIGGDPEASPPLPPDTLSLESGLTALRAVPRTEAGNYRAPLSDWRQVAGNRQLRVGLEPYAVCPHAVRDETYRLEFLAPEYDPVARQPVYRFAMTDQGGDTVVGTTSFGVPISEQTDTFKLIPTVFDSVVTMVQGDTAQDTTRAWLPVVQVTMKLQMDQIPLQFLSRVEVVSGSYPQDSLTVPSLANNNALWAYRGSDYRIIWRDNGGGMLTCDVHDLDNDIPVPYRDFPAVGGVPDSADGWCLRGIRNAGDTLSAGNTWYFYVCGSYFAFVPRGAIQVLPEAGDTWVLFNRTLSPSPSYSAFEVDFEAGGFGATMEALDVKVVPNPYLVRNEWERHPDFRRLKFINLPNRCTIRIYNLAGDLVRTLEHDETKPQVGGLPNQYGGDEDWDLLNESLQKPAPGLYIFHVESDQGTQVGKFVIVY